MYYQFLLNHIIVAGLGWILGAIIGIGLGIPLLNLWRRINLKSNNSWMSILIPWRSFIACLLLLNFIPFVPIIWFGVGILTGIISVGYVVALLTIIAVFYFAQPWSPGSFINIASGMRTLAVFSVLFTLYYSVLGSAGAGFIYGQQIRLLDYMEATNLVLQLSCMALFVDILTGFIQMIINRQYGIEVRTNAG